jgi:tetratricopeptide (TPR) repeat protein
VKEGDLAEAIRRFEEYLRRYPNDLEVRQEFAGVLTQAGERARAIQEYQKLMAARPGSAELSLGLASVYLQAQQYYEAIPLLRRALEQFPENLDLAARLARAYALDRDFVRAREVYTRYLAGLKPGAARVPRDLTGLLLDLQRPGEALTFLLPQREKKRDEIQIMAEIVRAHAALKDNNAALLVVEELGNLPRQSFAERLELGKALVSSGDDLVAAAVFGQILAAEPENLAAQLGMAQVQIHQFLPEAAHGLLAGIKPTPVLQRQWALVWGEYHQLVGEYVESKLRYVELLAKDPQDAEARLALGKLLQYIQEYEKAKAEYGKVPQGGSRGRQARLGIAATLYDQRRYGESAECCQRLLAEDPADGEAMARLIRDHIKMGDCNNGAALGRGFLNEFGDLEPVTVGVQLALGRALLECGQYADALQEYESLLARPTGRIAETWYGQSRSAAKLNHTVKSEEALTAAFSDPGHETRNQLLIADLFYADYDDRMAEQLSQAVVHHDPNNLAALIRLADAQLRAARPSANIDAVVRTAKAILTLSPSNVRGHLALARAYSLAQEYPAAVAQYDRLLGVDSAFLVPKIEKARALFSGNQFGASAAAYQSALHPDPSELLRAGLLSFLQCHPEHRHRLGTCMESDPRALAAELEKLPSDLNDPTVRSGVHYLLLDAEARAAEITVIRLEADAKCKRDWRNFTAKGLYQELADKQPDNIEAFFDLGQVEGQLRQTKEAMTAFRQVLQIDPLNREAAIALERAGLELSPNLTVLGSAYNQTGRRGEANCSRFLGGAVFNYPIGEEDEVLGAGAARLYYRLPGFPALSGDELILNASKRVNDHLLLYGLCNIEDYASRIETRPTYDLGARWIVCDGTTVTANTFLNNVVENGESVQQDIFRVGGSLGVESRLNRFWSAGGLYRFAYYSDVNRMSELFAHTDVLCCLPPNQLKFVASLDYLTYNHPTILGPGDVIFGAIHPYFSPADYAYAEGRVEFTHWFSRDYFVYADQCWVSLQDGLGVDNSAFVYNNFRGILNWDIRPWLSLGVQGVVQIAQVYNMQQASAYLIWRFPCRQ